MSGKASPQCANDWAILTIVIGHLGLPKARARYMELMEKANMQQPGLSSYEIRTILTRCGIDAEVMYLAGRDVCEWAIEQLDAGDTPLVRLLDTEPNTGPYWGLFLPLAKGGHGMVFLGTSQEQYDRIMGDPPTLDSIGVVVRGTMGTTGEACVALLAEAQFDTDWMQDIAIADWSVLALTFGALEDKAGLERARLTARDTPGQILPLSAGDLVSHVFAAGVRVAQAVWDREKVIEFARQEMDKGRTVVAELMAPDDTRINAWALVMEGRDGSIGLMVPNLTGRLHDRLFGEAPVFTGSVVIIHKPSTMSAEDVMETFHI